MNILYLANSMPYDTIRHAGGKTFNYYVSNISSDKDNNIKVIGICNQEELKELRFKGENVELIPVLTKGSVFLNLQRIAFDIVGWIFGLKKCDKSFYKYYKIKNELKELSFEPDVIVLEWTNMVLLYKTVKQRFPDAKLIASEHDVTYLGLERKGLSAKKLARAKKQELEALHNCDVVMPHNVKDKNLLVQDGIPEDKIHVIVPYYHNMGYIERKKLNHDILFWGAMYRPENYEAAIWFIENVMPLLEDLDVRFVVAGNRPPEKLKQYASSRVVITGFVENETPLFESSMCFVSPLLTGAGIKVKVIEALSAGIPILTNDIGIEGIPAVNGESYFHCEKPREYSRIIRELYNDEIDTEKLITMQRKVIAIHFNLEESYASYEEMLLNL
jgi:glycosyltransferase involved in cell wall biosynthesis